MEHTSGTDIPIICLDDFDDDVDDDLRIDKDYKLFLDHLREDISLGPLYETSVNNYLRYEVDDNGEESETRKFDTSVSDSKRSTTREKTERDNRVAERRIRKKIVEFEAARREKNNVGVASSQEDILRDENVLKRKIDAGSSRGVPVTRVGEVEDVDETASVETSKKNEEKSVVNVDEDYMSYLTWLVHSLKEASATKPTTENNLSHLDQDTLKDSRIVPKKNLLVKVKEELVDLGPWSDDSDIIAVSDSPFLDGVSAPFVASKSAINLDEESKDDESGSCSFRKELMDVLKKPYDEGELLCLSNEVSRKRLVTRCRELRKGRETNYETEEWGPSYLESHSDFDKEYKLVESSDKAKALKLLRGFFFYLVNVCRDGAFKPWMKNKRAEGDAKAFYVK